jgi:hypothetical protein
VDPGLDIDPFSSSAGLVKWNEVSCSFPASDIILGEYGDGGAEQWTGYSNRSTERRSVYSVQLNKWSENHFCRYATLRYLAW